MLGSLQLLQPTNVAEASGALRDFGERGKLYAGGAELLLLMRHGLLQSEVLVDVKKIERLHRIAWDDGALSVGACVTHHTLETRSEEHTSELQSQSNLVCRLLLEKKQASVQYALT